MGRCFYPPDFWGYVACAANEMFILLRGAVDVVEVKSLSLVNEAEVFQEVKRAVLIEGGFFGQVRLSVPTNNHCQSPIGPKMRRLFFLRGSPRG